MDSAGRKPGMDSGRSVPGNGGTAPARDRAAARVAAQGSGRGGAASLGPGAAAGAGHPGGAGRGQGAGHPGAAGRGQGGAASRGGGSGIGVTCRGLVYIYRLEGYDVVALAGVDLDIAAGESVALVGPSGAGKSTLLALLAGLLAPSAGRLSVGGHDLVRAGPAELARMRATDVGVVLQGASRNLLPYLSAVQNVRFAQRGVPPERRRGLPDPGEVLSLVGLGNRAQHRQRPGALTPGERQRLALAVGLAIRPGLLLADEPTSQLDSHARDEVLHALEAVGRAGTTVVVVTHDPDVGQRMTRTVTIRDGRVGAEGRRGEDFSVVGRDGSIHLPVDALDVFPPGSLVQVLVHPDGWAMLRPADTLTPPVAPGGTPGNGPAGMPGAAPGGNPGAGGHPGPGAAGLPAGHPGSGAAGLPAGASGAAGSQPMLPGRPVGVGAAGVAPAQPVPGGYGRQQPAGYGQPQDQYGHSRDQYGQPQDQYGQQPVHGQPGVPGQPGVHVQRPGPHGQQAGGQQVQHGQGSLWGPPGPDAGRATATTYSRSGSAWHPVSAPGGDVPSGASGHGFERTGADSMFDAPTVDGGYDAPSTGDGLHTRPDNSSRTASGYASPLRMEMQGGEDS